MKSTKKGLEPKHISSELVSKSIILRIFQEILRIPESKQNECSNEKNDALAFFNVFFTGNHTPHKPESYQSHSDYNDLVRFVFTNNSSGIHPLIHQEAQMKLTKDSHFGS